VSPLHLPTGSPARRALVGAATAVVVAALVVAGLTVGGAAPHRKRTSTTPHYAPAPPAAPVRTPPHPPTLAVSPATTVPAASPIQDLYDQSFEQGFSAPAARAELAQVADLHLPTPAVTGGWPALEPADTPDDWVRHFVAGLLDIDFVHRSRADLDRWLVAEHAPDLLPGIPTDARDGELYATVTDPVLTGQASPVPTANTWAADAAAGVTWAVADLQVQVDQQWQAMIDAGWQPRDLLAGVEDVSGALTVTTGTATVTHRFSMTVQVGSAAYHHGYGTVLVADWNEEQ
jgi:hypothetical protein